MGREIGRQDKFRPDGTRQRVQAQKPGTRDMGSKTEGCRKKKKKTKKKQAGIKDRGRNKERTLRKKSHDGSGTTQIV